jgi:hypothetical protein
MIFHPSFLVARLLTICLGLSLTAGWEIAATIHRAPIYSVAQVQRLLMDSPRAWSGRQVDVRALAGGCIPWAAPKHEPCIDEGPELVQLGPAGSGAALPLLCGSTRPLTALLWRIPWLGRRFLGLQALQPGALAVYRVQLSAHLEDGVRLVDSNPSCGPT